VKAITLDWGAGVAPVGLVTVRPTWAETCHTQIRWDNGLGIVGGHRAPAR
jgi:hypothetical protein